MYVIFFRVSQKLSTVNSLFILYLTLTQETHQQNRATLTQPTQDQTLANVFTIKFDDDTECGRE